VKTECLRIERRSCEVGVSDRRQYQHNLRQLKRLLPCVQNKKRGKVSVQPNNVQITQAYQADIDQAQYRLAKIQATLTKQTRM
jgi:uncharacterized protein YqiB (DUF1249 family)